jgi:hypothetical protein
MSKPEINAYDKGNMPPPSFEEAMQSEALKQGAAYHKQERWIPAVKPAGDGFPVTPASLVSEQSFLMTLRQVWTDIVYGRQILQLHLLCSARKRKYSNLRTKLFKVTI